MSRLLEKWGSAVHRYRWLIILLWAFIILAGIVFGTRLESRLSGYGWDVEGSESFTAQKQLAEGFAGRGPTALALIVKDVHHPVGSKAFSENLGKLISTFRREKSIENVYSWLDAAPEAKSGMTGKDGRTSFAYVGTSFTEAAAVKHLPDLQKRLSKAGKELGLEAYLIGTSALWADVNLQSRSGLMKVEMFVLPIVFIVLLLIFRSFVSAATSFAITLASVLAGLGITYLLTLWFDLSIFIVNTIMMLGLGLGIDYALFIVTRFKSELHDNTDPKAAMAKALSTSGHSVFFSGITVLFAVASIFIVPLPAIRSLALGAIISVSVSLLSGLTFLPSVLLLLGTRIHRGALPFLHGKEKSGKFWYALSHGIMKRPVLCIVIVVSLLLALAFPALDLKTFTPDATILPSDSPVKKGFVQLEQAFGTGAASTISIAVHSAGSPLTQAHNLQELNALYTMIMNKLQGKYESIQSLFSVFPGQDSARISSLLTRSPQQLPQGMGTLVNRYINEDGNTAVIDINPKGRAASLEARNLVKVLKKEILPQWNSANHWSVHVGGATSQGMDMNSAIQDRLAMILVIMLIFCYLVLFLTFRSILLPLKAILMNLLSVAATYGVLVFVFAKGHGASIFSIQPNGYIQNYIPLLLLTLLFSLSTDYEVFLLNSVKEEYEQTRNNTESVAVGLEKTAPLITGAALLMVIVFGGFAFSNMLPIQSLGFGMAVAILIDASIIRFILVPATMRLLGNWNWWVPWR